MVDGFLASCYASYPHQLAHLALAPARVWPELLLPGQNTASLPALVSSLNLLGEQLNLRDTRAAGTVEWLKQSLTPNKIEM